MAIITHEWQSFLILVCSLVSYPIVPIVAWQERNKFPTFATIVIAMWVFILPVFLLGFGLTLWPQVFRIVTAPFSSYEPSADPVSQQTRIRLRSAPRWDI